MEVRESGSRRRCLADAFKIAALGVFLATGSLAGQGTLSGTVTSQQTGQGLASVQVFIGTLDLGVLTQANGQYTIENVPAGTHEVAAQRLGYQTTTIQVSVSGGQTTLADFTLQEAALQLDAVIVTGTAGGSQRRALGNAVSQVTVDDLTALAPVSTPEEALAGRTPGVQLLPPSGAGAGSKIRIRGHSSMALSGDPIIYVDGVRLNDSRGAEDRHFNSSTLADFNPADIESIEVIKGPAAATLYGTEASDGVIQIITKSGSVGAPVFEVSTEFGQNYWPNFPGYERLSWFPDPEKCPSVPCASADQLIGINMRTEDIQNGFGDAFQDGIIQRINIGVRGGTDLIRYSFGATQNREEGIVSWNNDERNSIRGNLQVTATENLNIQLSGGYFQNDYQPPESFWAGNYGWGSRPQTYRDFSPTSRRGWRNGPPLIHHRERFTHNYVTKRSVWSLQTTLETSDWLTHRLVMGMDQLNLREAEWWGREGHSRFHGTRGRIGAKDVRSTDSPVYTVDFSGTANFRFNDGLLGSAFSYGAQFYNKQEIWTRAYGQNFAVLALSTVGGAAVTEANETFLENTTLGWYVQEQLDWDNRVFLTGAVRFDDNSAFGTDFDLAVYPKVSAAWVLSEEAFWDVDWIDQLRLRGAWGQAGKQPDAFAATQLFEPVTGPGQQPILTPDSFGNPVLGPEKGSEIEVGFEGQAFDGRIAFDFTYYNRKTNDAIVAKTVPPSVWPGAAGDFAGGTQFVNIGQISGWGTETALNIQAIREGPVRWDLDLAFTTQGNRIDDMGGIERIQVGRTRAHYEGHSIASQSDFKVVSAEFVNGVNGEVTNVMCDGGTGPTGVALGGPAVPCSEAPKVVWGKSDPTWLVNLNQTLTFFDDWRASVNIDAMGGHWMGHDYATARYTSHPSSQLVWLQDDPIQVAYLGVTRNGFGFAKAGFAKLREVALSYTIPGSLAERIGASSASIRVGARNIARLWIEQAKVYDEFMADPEMTRDQGGDYDFAGESGGGWPPLAQWTARLNVTF